MVEQLRENGRRARAQVERQMESLVAEQGPWTAHDITLAPGVQTLGADVADSRLRRIVQLVADTAGKPIDRLRILDLGCLEGQFAIEFAMHGASVVAIEGREANLCKSRFAAEALGVAGNVDLRKADVRELNAKTFGTFDVVLCLGVLYHLDAPDVMELVAAMSEVCTGILAIDTHISMKPRAEVEWRGHRYWGDFWTEYAPGARKSEEDRALWSSIGNDRSFLLTKASLSNLLQHTGFTSAYECLNPCEYHSAQWPKASSNGQWMEWPDRATFVAVKGARQRILSSARTNSEGDHDHPETPLYLDPICPVSDSALSRARRLMATAVRQLVRPK